MFREKGGGIMDWWVFVSLAVFYWVMRQIAFWFPELGLEAEIGRVADALAPWILLGVGLILRKVGSK